jgi:hypothetical protein
MPYELLFWIIMLFLILFNFASNANPTFFGPWGWLPNSLLLWVLLALLGWKVFGPALHG